ERFALPAAAITARPLLEVWRQLWTPIKWDEAHVVEHFDENHDVSRRLYKLVGIVVRPWKHWRPDAIHMNTSNGEGLVLCRIIDTAHALSFFGALGGSLLSLFR